MTDSFIWAIIGFGKYPGQEIFVGKLSLNCCIEAYNGCGCLFSHVSVRMVLTLAEEIRSLTARVQGIDDSRP